MIRDSIRSEDVLFAFGCVLYGLIALILLAGIVALIRFFAH